MEYLFFMLNLCMGHYKRNLSFLINENVIFDLCATSSFVSKMIVRKYYNELVCRECILLMEAPHEKPLLRKRRPFFF